MESTRQACGGFCAEASMGADNLDFSGDSCPLKDAACFGAPPKVGQAKPENLVDMHANAAGCGGKPPKKKPKVPVLEVSQTQSPYVCQQSQPHSLGGPSSQQLKLISQQSYYTRHPHYPDVKLNTRMPQMTGSTLSTSNKSTNEGGNNVTSWLRDLSDTNSAIDEPLSHLSHHPT